MSDPRLTWFAMGSLFVLVLHGWPPHRRYSRFNHENKRGPVGPRPLRFQRSKPVRFTEGRTIRGNGHGGPKTPKPNIVPQPQSTDS